MEFLKKVQFLGHSVNNSNLHCYDFLDLESNLPFTVYSMSNVDYFDKLELYKQAETKFNLVLSKDKTGIRFKVKAVANNGK